MAVGTDIHDRKLAEEALRQEYQKKDEFLAAVAHELRNPLAPIRSLQRILSLFGHEVRVAYDGAAAIRLADEFRPRVAVLDIGMPGTNGYDVARALRERHSAGITLVALTGWGQDSDRRRALDAGFDYQLAKPVDPESLNRLFAEVEKK